MWGLWGGDSLLWKFNQQGVTLPSARIIQQFQMYLTKILLTSLTVSWKEFWFCDFCLNTGAPFIYDPVKETTAVMVLSNKFCNNKILLLQKWNYKIWACGEAREPRWSCNTQLSFSRGFEIWDSLWFATRVPPSEMQKCTALWLFTRLGNLRGTWQGWQPRSAITALN